MQQQWFDNRIAVAKDQAVELNDKGDRQQAGQVLKAVSDDYLTWSTANGFAPGIAEAKKLEAQADQVQAAGIDNVNRKLYRAESQQTKSQQYAK